MKKLVKTCLILASILANISIQAKKPLLKDKKSSGNSSGLKSNSKQLIMMIEIYRHGASTPKHGNIFN